MFRLLIHGGAGELRRQRISGDKESALRETMAHALVSTSTILHKGGSALDAVEQAVRVLEDSPLFNAGRGSVYNHKGTIEMDASIMDGGSRDAGAIAAVSTVRNPISTARAVMEQSPHVLLAGRDAEAFAQAQQQDIVDTSYFFTQSRWKAWHRLHGTAAMELDHDADEKDGSSEAHGTVGAVALDLHGNLAAATSTGGMTNKQFGRIGDTAIIGAGTYADNAVCAVSTTGKGEYFMRGVSAYDVAAQMRYAGLPLEKAVNNTLDTVRSLGGEGGLIAVDKWGNTSLGFNTAGMFRGYIDESRKSWTAIFRENSL